MRFSRAAGLAVVSYSRCVKILLILSFGPLLISCSHPATGAFEALTHKVENYLAKKPIWVTSQSVTPDAGDEYAYYALKIVRHTIRYDVIRQRSSVMLYKGFIRVLCDMVGNAKAGDVFPDGGEFQSEVEILEKEALGFSTTDMALHNTDFSAPSKMTMIIRYAYHEDKWVFAGIEGGYPSESLVRDLSTFPQNEGFRRAVGMGD